LHSKLPDVGTTIFAVMSRRARELGAINVGQGFPDYAINPRLADLLGEAAREGYNQYAPMEGSIELREEIARKLHRSYGIGVDPEAEVTVTLGATESLFSAIQAVVGPGDEVLAFDPSYDVYEPAVRLAGGRCVRIPLEPPGFRYDWERIAAAVTPRTRLVIVNSPLNPACTAATEADMLALAALCERHGMLVLSDEVYEHVIFDGRRHESALTYPALRNRSFAVFSFGKTLHATGWRIGYTVAPPPLTAELRKVHQFNTFSIHHPQQRAIAVYLREKPEAWMGLAEFFQAKRDRLRAALAGTGFDLPPSQGTFFQLVGYGRFSGAGDIEFAERLLVEAGVATIPLSPFYERPPASTYIRLCIAKKDATLDAAAARLVEFARRLA
jgi:methionine aminotransferase